MSSNPFINPLPGVPDVESPFFDELFAAKDASSETMAIARDLREKGYAVFDFPDPEFDSRAARIKERLGKTFDFDLWREDLWHKNNGLRVQDAWESDPDVRAIATNPKLLTLLGELYGRRAFPFQTLNFPVGTQQHVHNDSLHFSSVPERFMCGVWVAMEDIDENNGALEYYPGSHKFPTYVNEHIGVCSAEQVRPDGHYPQLGALWQTLIKKSGIQPDTFHAKKGQALIWAANLLHGGSRHLDNSRTRWSQVTHYYFDDCVYYTPLLSDPAYGKIYYRDLIDISTGKSQLNRYAGRDVPREVINRSMPDIHRSKAVAELPAGFNPARYLELNEDVARAKVDPAQHYLEFGVRERRRWQ